MWTSHIFDCDKQGWDYFALLQVQLLQTIKTLGFSSYSCSSFWNCFLFMYLYLHRLIEGYQIDVIFDYISQQLLLSHLHLKSMFSHHLSGQTLAPWAGQSNCRPTSLKWRFLNWRCIITTLTSSLRSARAGLTGKMYIFIKTLFSLKGIFYLNMMFILSEKLSSTWSSTLKHRFLVTESLCMMDVRISTQQCLYL